MQFNRFMRANDFVRELDSLRAFRGEYMGTGLLESLDAARLLHPRIRIRYPDAIARRFWLEKHDHFRCQLGVVSPNPRKFQKSRIALQKRYSSGA